MSEKEKFEFGVEIKKILKLMIHSLYTNRDVAIRELISNASDACDKLRYKATQDDRLIEDDKELKVRIEIDKDKKTLSIIDNGIGMDRAELISQLGTIAKSGTEAFLKNLGNDDAKNLQLIGQFGVGFYSAFMIADKVSVISRKAGKKKVNQWESEGDGKYTVEEVNEEYPRGTRIVLHLKSDQEDFLDKIYLGNIIKLYSDHINVPVELQMDDGKFKVMNTGSALWARPKNEITKEQYQEFYTHVSHMPGEPFLTLHNKAEGIIEFTNLIFIPDRKPVDLYMPERESKIKLYVKKVFITDDAVQLLPAYLRFARGIVDSEDLPLNINRESLQYNNLVEKIKKSLTKRILSELEKKMNEDPEEYLKFWENFGPVVKEGLCEGSIYNTEIFNICKFYSSKSPDKLITLNDYIERMKPKQENIFYITGDSVRALENSPQIEGFKDKDIEVLYLIDTVDNFWVTVQNEYKGKEFKSITKGDIDIENLNDEPQDNDDDDDEVKFDDDKEEKKAKDITNSKYDDLINFIKDSLKDKVNDVKVSKKLTSSPVCLVADKKAMDIRLERYLLDQNQIQRGMLKNIEINTKHPIIKEINDNLGKPEKLAKMKEIVDILFDEACIIEGEPVSNPGEFAKRLNKLLINNK